MSEVLAPVDRKIPFPMLAQRWLPLIKFAAGRKAIGIHSKEDLVQEGMLLLLAESNKWLESGARIDGPDFERFFKTALWNRFNSFQRHALHRVRNCNATFSANDGCGDDGAPLWSRLADLDLTKDPASAASFHDLLEMVEFFLAEDAEARRLFLGIIRPDDKLLQGYEDFCERKSRTGERSRSKLPIPPKIFQEVFGWSRLKFRRALRTVQQAMVQVLDDESLVPHLEKAL